MTPANESVEMSDMIEIYKGMLAKANHDLAIMEARVVSRNREIQRLNHENNELRQSGERPT